VSDAVSQLSDIDLTPELAIKLVIAGGTDSVKFSVVIYVAVIVVICCWYGNAVRVTRYVPATGVVIVNDPVVIVADAVINTPTDGGVVITAEVGLGRDAPIVAELIPLAVIVVVSHVPTDVNNGRVVITPLT
jgi:hypothetical protein